MAVEVKCFYCPESVVVEDAVMGGRETAYQAMKAVGWLLGVRQDGVVTTLDPICHECGRGVVQAMLKAGHGRVSPQAKQEMGSLYPELFGEQVLN